MDAVVCYIEAACDSVLSLKSFIPDFILLAELFIVLAVMRIRLTILA
ncbi:hypothetical protein [Pseudoalteromonas aurantia]|nr:hypothetical protein [Pseudoalteromonas aurantia]